MNITNIHKNCMGTISFDAQFKGMRKPKDFIVYPNPENGVLFIQGDTYCGYIDTRAGTIKFGKARNSWEMKLAALKTDVIDNIADLITAVRATASPMAGTNGIVFCDNSTAGQL
jgi:hypothetical protein